MKICIVGMLLLCPIGTAGYNVHLSHPPILQALVQLAGLSS